MKKGIQLYSVRDKCTDKKTLFNTISSLAKMGYDGVEFFEYFGASAEEVSKVLNDVNIEGFNSHVSLAKWYEAPDKEIEFAANAGMKNISLAWIPPDQRNLDTYKRVHSLLADMSKKCADHGITMCYHNHDFEYKKIDGRYVLDMILQNNDSVTLELDTFWVHYCGLDPADEMKKYAQRLKLLHIKDYLSKAEVYTNIETDIQFCPIGTGKMDNRTVINKAKQMGMEWIVVDLDNSPIDTLETARVSIDYLKNQI